MTTKTKSTAPSWLVRDMRIDDPTTKLFLYAYASRANHLDGSFRASYSTIKADTGIKSNGTISKTNNYLRELGLLDWQKGSAQTKKANSYRLNLQRIAELNQTDGTSACDELASACSELELVRVVNTTSAPDVHQDTHEDTHNKITSEDTQILFSGDESKSAALDDLVYESPTRAEGFYIAEGTPQKAISCNVTPSPQNLPASPLPHGDLEIAALKAAFDAAELPEGKRAAHQRWKEALEDNWREAQDGSAERLAAREAYISCSKASHGAPWRPLAA